MKTLVLGITSQASRPARSSNRSLSLVVWGWHVGLVGGRRAVCQASCRVLERSHIPWSIISGSEHHVTQPGGTQSGVFMPQPPLWHGPHRLVVRTSRCGRDNPGSTPGVDIFLPRNKFMKRPPADCMSWSISCFLQSSILAPTPSRPLWPFARPEVAYYILKTHGSGCHLCLDIQRRQRWISALPPHLGTPRLVGAIITVTSWPIPASASYA